MQTVDYQHAKGSANELGYNNSPLQYCTQAVLIKSLQSYVYIKEEEEIDTCISAKLA